LKSKIDEMR